MVVFGPVVRSSRPSIQLQGKCPTGEMCVAEVERDVERERGEGCM